jgi:hypothetical protein
VLDWPNDEQPVAMTTPNGSIVSVPMLVDFDDVYALFHRKITDGSKLSRKVSSKL